MTTIAQDTNVDEQLLYLRNKSRQLKEYSRWLKDRSQELQYRFQLCVNSKRPEESRLALERELTFGLDRLPDSSDSHAPYARRVMIESCKS